MVHVLYDALPDAHHPRVCPDVERIAELYRAGWAIRKIADAAEVPYQAVRAILCDQGVELRRRGGHRADPHDNCVSSQCTREVNVARAIDLYQKGWPLKLIAGETGLSPHAIRRALRTRGVPTRRSGTANRYPDPDPQQVIDLYQAGRSLHQVAADLSTYYNTVRAILCDHGVAIRPPGNTGPGAHTACPAGHCAADATIARAIELYRAGWILSRITAATGRSPTTIYRDLRIHGVPPRRPATTHTQPPDRDRIVALYREGHSLAQVTAATGTSTAKVRDILRDHGVAMRPQATTRRDADPEQITHLYQSGWSLRQIIRATGVPYQTVRTTLINQGVELRPRGTPPHRPRTAS